MRLLINVAGAEQLARALDAQGRRVTGDLRPLLDAVAADWVTHFQDNIREEGRGGVSWPQLQPATIRIRIHYGHGIGPKLIRGGDLLHSIQLLDAGETWIEVGSRQTSGPVPVAAILQRGGTVTDARGRKREVPPFPFVYLTAQDVDDTVEMIGVYLFGDGGNA